MAIVKRFNVNTQQATLDADIIENMSANDVSYDASTQYDENTVGDKLSELEYDVTKNNDGATFASLSELLSSENLSNLIPTSVRHGGMSIRFVNSSDNKYVQYFLRNDEWSVNKGDWEEINTKTGKYLLMTFGSTPGYVSILTANKKVSLNYNNPSIGVSNLINVNKTVPQIIHLNNLWNNAGAALSYVITDENLIALQVISGVSSATIDSSSLPEGARFLIANSCDKNGVIGTSDLSIADSGIPLYVALNLLDNKETLNKFIIKSASIGNSDCYINNSVQVGFYLSKTNITYLNSGNNVVCTNLLCIKKEHNLSLTNLFNNALAAPSYIILDKYFKVLDVKLGVSSVLIDIDNLPDDSFYLIANSNSTNTTVTTDKFYPLINTGISVVVLTEILQNNARIDSSISILNSF